MRNKIFTPGELVTIKTNLKEIEKVLGRPIPGGLVDVDDLKDHILRPGELLTISHNLNSIRGRETNSVRYKRHYAPSPSEVDANLRHTGLKVLFYVGLILGVILLGEFVDLIVFLSDMF